MEKVYFTNSRGMKLAGNYRDTDGKTIILFCHGFLSDKSSRGRFDRFAEVLSKDGYATLAFDFSGCGESDDDFITVKKETDDLISALAFARQKGYDRVGLYGHSLGSRICLEACAAAGNIKAMIFTGAATGPVYYQWEEHFSKEQLKELEEKGYITVQTEGLRKQILIDGRMLLDFEKADQKKLLSKIDCPVLILHGEDWEEKMLSELTRKGMELLNADSRMVIISGASHSFMEHLDIVEKYMLQWFRKHLPI
ncbi:alpha/beta hydrolase family protein [Metabacillus sp. RGM 3146]|uniref:alpha/beta hydrolase family protein n=1 Tax=Metabacillus sp. RGM 3146 TaxID=3401092 RepID=UPI003B99C077